MNRIYYINGIEKGFFFVLGNERESGRRNEHERFSLSHPISILGMKKG